MRIRLTVLSLTFIVALVGGVVARQAGPAQLALEAARKTEVVDRNLPAAIVQYRDVAAKYESDNTVAPAALLQLAGCYEQLRQPEARATYQRIVKYYPDSAPATTARAKLAGAQRNAGLTTTQLLDAPDGAPSPDGRYFTETSKTSGDLSVRDMRSGRSRTVTRNPKKESPYEYPVVMESVPSPNGRQIAYVWAPSDVWDLRVINYDGSHERVLCCREKLGAVPPSDAYPGVFGWSGDGTQILFAFAWEVPGSGWTTELMTVAAAGGPPRVLKHLKGTWAIRGASWSPDGRFIVYDASPTDRETAQHDLFIMRADGSHDEPLITHGADDRMLHWFPDGQRILFLSDRPGSTSAYALNMANGKAVGDAELVKPLVGDLRGHGFTSDGAYYYHVLTQTEDLFTARLSASGIPSSKLEPVPDRFSGGKTDGVWSADGSRIAYVHLPFDVTSEPSLSIQTVSTRQVQTIPVHLKTISQPAWMPDGRAIIVEGSNAEGGQGLFRIDVNSGTTSAIGDLTTNPAATRYVPVVSSNGQEVLYALGEGATFTSFAAIQARDLASGALRMVFDGPILNFALSPDGRFVAISSPNFQGATDQTPRLRVVPIAGGELRAIGAELPSGFYEKGLAWSADGRYLYFGHSGYETGTKLWRVPVDGGPAQPTDIPLPKQRVFRISVHPDGQLAISSHSWNIEYWVMRNIPPAAKR